MIPLCAAALAVLLACLAPTAAAQVVPAPTVESEIRWQPLYEPGVGGRVTDVEISPFDSNRVLVAGDMLGVGLSTDRGESWESTFGLAMWEMGAFTWHPTDGNVVWVGGVGGPYCSTDGGKHWMLRRDGMPEASGGRYTAPIELVLFDPADPSHQTLLAFGGSRRGWSAPDDSAWGAVWKSTNGGGRWSRLTTITDAGSRDGDGPGDNITWAAYAPGDPDTLYAQTPRSFLASTDGGRTWKPRNAGLPSGAVIGNVAVHPRDPGVLWAAVGNFERNGTLVSGGVYKTVDAGRTWRESSAGIEKVLQSSDPMQSTRFESVAVSESDPDVVYANDAGWATGVTYRSTDGGEHWEAVMTKRNLGSDASPDGVFQLETACPAGAALAGLEIDPRDASAVFGYNTEFLARTLDDGRTWDDASSYRPDPAKPHHWRGRGYAGWCSTAVTFDPFRKNRLILQAMDAAQAWLSDDGGESWTYHHAPSTAWSGGTDAAFSRDGTIYVATGPHGWMGIGKSADGGKTWQWFAGEAHGLPEPSWGQQAPGAIHVHPDDSNRVWAVIGAKLYHSADGGHRWRLALNQTGLNWIAADPRRADTFYVSSHLGVFRTVDGEAFTNIGGPKNNGRLAIDSLGRVLVAAHQGERPGIWRFTPETEEEGQGDWRRLWDEHWVHDVAVDPTDPDRILASTNQNPYADLN